jgi:hypothetical protein
VLARLRVNSREILGHYSCCDRMKLNLTPVLHISHDRYRFDRSLAVFGAIHLQTDGRTCAGAEAREVERKHEVDI